MFKSLKRAAWLVLGCCAPALAQSPWIEGNVTPVGPETANSFDDRSVSTWWDNGPCDDVTALQSQSITVNNVTKWQLVADDYMLKAGLYYYYDSISFDFYVNSGTLIPNWRLDVYVDCNGKPAALDTTYTVFSSTNQGPSAQYPGYTKWNVKFTGLNRFEAGHQSDCTTSKRYWVSPVGLGSGLYFWRSANNGVIQGAVAMYKNNFVGDPAYKPDWTEVFDVCCNPHCTDFCFVINGHVCCLLADNSKYELTGLGSLQQNIITFGTRAADNFQVPPGGCCVDVCRIEAWIATNCAVEKSFLEIYDNDCNCPRANGDPPLYTLVNPEVFATGATTTDGIPVYRLRWNDPGICLAPGRDYWLSAVARGSGQISDVAYFLFKDHNINCPILISEGKYKNCFLGPTEFTKVSDPTVFGLQRDFAFRVYIKAPACAAGSDVGTGCPSDFNRDGFVNGDDYDFFTAAFEAGC